MFSRSRTDSALTQTGGAPCIDRLVAASRVVDYWVVNGAFGDTSSKAEDFPRRTAETEARACGGEGEAVRHCATPASRAVVCCFLQPTAAVMGNHYLRRPRFHGGWWWRYVFARGMRGV